MGPRAVTCGAKSAPGFVPLCDRGRERGGLTIAIWSARGIRHMRVLRGRPERRARAPNQHGSGDHHPGRPAGPRSCTAGDGRPASRPDSHTLRQLSCLRSPVGPANWTAPVAAKAPAPPLGPLAIVFRAKQSCGAQESAPLHPWRAMAARASAATPVPMQPPRGRRSRARRDTNADYRALGNAATRCAARRTARRRLNE